MEDTLKGLFLRFAGSGDTGAFDELVRAFTPELRGYVGKVIRHRSGELTDDVTQNVWLTIYRRAESFDSAKPLRPWLFTIAHNAAIDAVRRDAKHLAVSLGTNEELAPTAPVERDDMEIGEEIDWLESALPYLTAIQAESIRLTYHDGLTCREAGEKLGIPRATVKSRCILGLKKLRRIAAEDGIMINSGEAAESGE